MTEQEIKNHKAKALRKVQSAIEILNDADLERSNAEVIEVKRLVLRSHANFGLCLILILKPKYHEYNI
jgi:hypothetical protein